MPVSETEKHGISRSGCRFSEKVEHVPIKKRRFLLRTPSPPPVKTSPCVEETADHTKSQDDSDKLVSSDVILSQTAGNSDCLDVKKSVKSKERFGKDEDFSGISILAAAACSSSLGRDCGYAEDGLGIEESSVLERAREVSSNTEVRSSSKGLSKEDIPNSSEMSSGATSSCVSTEPVGELASISNTVNSSQKVVTVGKGMTDASLAADSLTFSGDVSCSKDEEIARNLRLSSRDERLHWDLNVVMDAWDQPFDDLNAQKDGTLNISEDPVKVNCNDMQSGGHDLRDNLGTICASQSCLLPGKAKTLVNQSKDNHDVNACHNLEKHPTLGDKSLSPNSKFNFDVMKCAVEDTKCRQVGETIYSIDGLVVATPEEMAQRSSSCVKNEADGEHGGNQSVTDNVGVSSCDLQNLGNACASDATFGADSADTHIGLYVSSCSDTLMKFKPNVTVSEDQQTPKILHHEVKDLAENVDQKTEDPQDLAEIAISEDKCLPRSDASNSVSKRYGELQEDYDSQYEDGELRESSGRAWEEFDREAENLDYVSDFRETYIAYPSDSGQVEDRKSGTQEVAAAVSSHDCNVDNEVHWKSSEAVGNERRRDEGNKMKLSNVMEKVELSQEKYLLESSKSFSDVDTRETDDNEGKDKMPCHIDRSLDPRVTEITVEPKALRRGLQSQIEGSVARGDTSREDQLKKVDNRFESGSLRSIDRVRYSFHSQVRGRQGESWDGSSDSRRFFRRHYSPIIRGHSKLDDDAVVERDNLGCVDTQDNASYSQQHFPKTRAGAEGEPCSGFHSRYNSDRKFSPDRGGGFGGGRSFRFGPFGESRGRGRYGPSPDETFQSSLKYRRPLSRRERSISPFGGRGQSNMHHSRRKSPSRSRSRSPIIWNSPRRRMGAGSGGNTFLRQRSRSPNFRSEARMQRLRSPPGIGVDHAGGFRSISRNHDSSPRNRWSSVRKDELGQFRELGLKQRTSGLDRSPGRIRLRGDRASAIDSPRNMKPDGYYRISDRMPGDAGRGVRYEENYEERRKQYNVFRPTRRNYDDGMASRLHQDINDGFSMTNNFRDRDTSSFQDRGLRGIDNRLGDLPRRYRGENHSFIYERDGKFNQNSKQFGVDVINSSHNLKSDEQYRPNYRFSDISGANRGFRYENFEERRKHYGPTNILRCSDNEDTEKRLNDDENIEDAREFSGRVTRGFDGRVGGARFREDEEPVVCAQKEKLDDNCQPVGVQNSGENDTTTGVVPS